MDMMTRLPHVVLNTDEMTLGVPMTNSVNHWLGKLHNGPEQRMAFDH